MTWKQLFTLESAIHFIEHPENFDAGAKEDLRLDIWEFRNYVLERCETTFPQSPSLVPEGAESADIGKLDAVDEKACTHCEWTHGYHRYGCPNFKFIKPGSAETGGEKA